MQDPCDRYRLILLNDSEHTFDYVIDMLMAAFAMPEEQAIEHAMEVDVTGRRILTICPRDEAARGRDLITTYGADPRLARSKGSMAAIIELNL